MKCKKLVTSIEASRLVPFAEEKLTALEHERSQKRLPFLKKKYTVSGITILLHAAGNKSKIIILGGNEWNMIFSSFDEPARTYGYNYLSTEIDNAFQSGIIPTNPIYPFVNGFVHADNSRAIGLAAQQWQAYDLDSPVRLTHIATNSKYELSIFVDGNVVYGRSSFGFGKLAAVNTTDKLIPSLSGKYLSLFGIAHSQTSLGYSSPWNLYSGAELSFISPISGDVGIAWSWVPSFFYVVPGDPNIAQDYMYSGWNYGAYPFPEYAMVLSSLKVSLCAICDTYDNTTDKKTGWCEVVTEVNGEECSHINFYTYRNLPSFGNPMHYYELGFHSLYKNLLVVGSAPSGFERGFTIEGLTPGKKPDYVKMWNFLSFGGDGFAAIVREGEDVRGYKSFGGGGAIQFIGTNKFHSFAISQDGSLVAIFETEGNGIISNARVFDLRGTREEKTAKDPVYKANGYTEISNGDVLELSASSACFIPFRTDDYEYIEPLYTLGGNQVSVIESSDHDYMSALATLTFIRGGAGSLIIEKVVCENGIDAEFGISVDECMQSTIYLENPDSSTDTDKLVALWKEGSAIPGKIRGDFKGTHPNIRFQGIYSSNDYGTATLPPNIGIGVRLDGSVYFDNAVGTIEPGSCLEYDDQDRIVISQSCFDPCGGDVVLTAGTSCGQSGRSVLKGSEPEPLMLEGPEVLGEGPFILSGGTAPYIWSMSCGEMLENGTIINFEGCCGSVTVTVRDGCGQSASLSVRAEIGYWNIVSITPTDACGDRNSEDYEDWMGFCSSPSTGFVTCYCGSSYEPDSTATSRTSNCAFVYPYIVDGCNKTGCVKFRSEFQCEQKTYYQGC